MAKIMVSKAPDDPQEKKEWVSQMMRVQIAMWVDDKATCIECGHTYSSVDDFIRCNPVRGHTKDMSFVCSGCYPVYKEKVPRSIKEINGRQNLRSERQ